MINQLAERTMARFLGIGSGFVAILVITGSVTDPVNVTKLLALGGVAAAAVAVLLAFGLQELWASSKTLVIFVGLFLVAGFNAIVTSDGPLTQNLYGAYGRNTAFITYLLLLSVILSAAVLRRETSFKYLIWGMFGAGFVNVIYCGWVIAFGDFVPWSNPYGNILGTFGNPNFIGAFLGMFGACIVAYSFKSGTSVATRIAVVLLLLLTTYEIIDSSAIQGRVVLAAGLGIVGFYFVRSRFEAVIAQIAYLIFIGIAGSFALLGALQIGPLTKYIYKTSVSLRGEYWQAGWNMGNEHPFTGVGFDTYGDWYRRARDLQALVLPGPETTTNAAHNVPFDLFAFGGWPLFLSYIGILILSGLAIIKVTRRNRKYDALFVTLTTAWACYQLQSIISINQIGLAIWGWLFSGALIAYEIATRPKADETQNGQTKVKGARVTTKKQSEAIVSSTLLAGVGAVIGLLIAAPPYSADAKWRSALKSQDLKKIELALEPGYLNPPNSYKYANAVQILESSKLFELAHKYAEIGVQFNPDNFDAWRVFYFVSKSSAEEKAIALENMKRLDPKNSNVLGNP
jgi:O-antigen ligase